MSATNMIPNEPIQMQILLGYVKNKFEAKQSTGLVRFDIEMTFNSV